MKTQRIVIGVGGEGNRIGKALTVSELRRNVYKHRKFVGVGNEKASVLCGYSTVRYNAYFNAESVIAADCSCDNAKLVVFGFLRYFVFSVIADFCIQRIAVACYVIYDNVVRIR